jgi:tetratricopeptide repeat protein
VRRKTSWILAASVAALVAVVALAATAAVPPNIARTVEAQRRLATERPNDPAVFNDLGNVLMLASQPAEAEAAYRRAIELDPNKTTALYNLALLLQQRGELGEAMDLYSRVVKLEPRHAWAHYQIGTLQERWGHDSRAIDEYAAAFALDPQLAFPEVNPHIVDNKLVTQAMMRAYQSDFTPPQAPRIYDDPNRIATLLVPPPAAAQGEKDQVTNQPPQPQTPQGRPPATTGKAQPSQGQGAQVLRERDLQHNPSGQATPQGAGRSIPGAGVPGSRQTPPRGLQQWNRPEPQIQEVPTEVPEEQPAPVITPPPGGVYYRPGIQSTGRLGLQLAPEKRAGRG